jgi:outer membrane lipoprotein-sorting protein
MRFFRTTSTARLLAFVVGIVFFAGATAAITVAATSQGGSKPAPKPLAQAVHDSLAGPRVSGVTARIKFTNHLIDSAAVPGATPLLSGASGRLWASSDGKVRLELQATGGDSQLIFDGSRVLVYDASSNTAYRGQIPDSRDSGAQHKSSGPPSIAEIQKAIGEAGSYAGLSGATPTTAAGQSAYQVRVTPHHGGQVSGAQLAWDALRGVPLKVAIYARGNSSPVLALSVQKISYGSVPASVFSISPPKGAHVVDVTPPSGNDTGGKKVTGPAAVQRALPFTLSAPSQLVGKSRQEVKLLGSDAALVTYGQGLDGLAVIERKADTQPQSGGPLGGAELPTVSIGGSKGQELPTALGTVVRFSRGGVDYTVLGSQPSATVLAAARAL